MIDRSKGLDVLVETLTGLAHDVPARSLRPWLDRPAGKQEAREDGDKARRVSLRQNTPPEPAGSSCGDSQTATSSSTSSHTTTPDSTAVDGGGGQQRRSQP